ncbi:MAG: GatB/YqeY domain-containing protein [Anaerolineae bacterium]|nr:GatB/YqeY domain-containing protein [Anaerolineae bacterium]
MSLQDRLHQDLRDAMRAQDAPRKSAVRMVIAAIQLAQVETSEPLGDAEVIALIRKEVKRREEAVEMMREAGREELVPGEVVELDVLKAYLPALMSEEAVTELVKQKIDELGVGSMRELGRVMGTVMPLVKGKADGKMVNQVVRRLLSG